MNKQQIEQMAEDILNGVYHDRKEFYPVNRAKIVAAMVEMYEAAAGKESEGEAAEPKIFKCKCGYETSNSTAWCTHADSCNA